MTITVGHKANGVSFKAGSKEFASGVSIGAIGVSGKVTIDMVEGLKDPATIGTIAVGDTGSVAMTERLCNIKAPEDWKIKIEASDPSLHLPRQRCQATVHRNGKWKPWR